MLFSSLTFIYIFLPIVCSIYFLFRRDLQNYILLIASILFYAWGEPCYLAIMLLTILINYFGANYIDHTQKELHRKLILIITIFLNLSFLFYFKYFNFVLDNIHRLFKTNIEFIDVIMPIGISFYTFQALSYLIDVYRGDVKAQKDIYKLSLYICLFPQLIAGPIVKYHDIEKQLDTRNVRFEQVVYGFKRFIIGLAKKILIANTLGAVVDKIFNQPVEQLDILTTWLGAVAYSLQLFFDFSGYSDMAIGLGSVFGFKFLENFNYPYISKSITEFWHRWHISLSSWFKNYLYIPLGGNKVSQKRTYFNLLIVFLATGIWHGTSWTFIVWGLWHGLFIIFEKATGFYKKEGNFCITVSKHLYTILIFIIGWVIFRSENINYAYTYIKTMFGLENPAKVLYKLEYYIDNIEIIAFIIGIICSIPIFKKILNIKHKMILFLINIWLITLFIISTASITASTYNPFIYFRF